MSAGGADSAVGGVGGGARRLQTRRLLMIVALVAALARVGYEAALHGTASPVGTTAAHLVGDERAYDALARQIAAGTLNRERAFYQEPFYAWMLGQVYRAFPPGPIGPDAAAIPKSAVHEGVIVAQHALGVLTAVLVALLGLRCLGPAVGLLAGLFAALSGPTIFAESMLLKESVALLLWVISLHLWLSLLRDLPHRRRRAAVLGVCLGLGVLLRGNTYLLLAGVLATLVLRGRERRRLPEAALVLGCALLALSPATLHNLRRGDVVLSTYQAGSNAAIGQPDSDLAQHGVAYEPIHAGHGDALFEEADAIAVAEAATGRRMTGREISAWWWRETFARVREHPLAAAQRVGLKLLHTFHGNEIPDVKDWAFFEQAVPWLGTPLSDLTWLGPLGLLGLLLLPWRRRDATTGLLVLRLSVLVVMASLALFYVMGRYRLAAAPALWIASAGALVGGARLLVGRRPILLKAGAVLLAAGVVAAGYADLPPGSQGLHVSWSNLASIELAAARAATDPAEARRHRDTAVAAARKAREIAPSYPEAHAMEIRALDVRTPVLEPAPPAEGRERAWRLLLLMLGEYAGVDVSGLLEGPLSKVIAAVDKLGQRPPRPERALYVSSTMAFACRRIAQDLKAPSDLPVALTLMDLAVSLEPDDPAARVQRGLVRKRLDQLPEAEADYRKALELGDDTVELHNNLGNLLLETGHAVEAMASFERALALDPGNAKVEENLERARAAAAGGP